MNSIDVYTLNKMTLKEILIALKLPSRLLIGDPDHNETTAAMDAFARENAQKATNAQRS